MDKRYSKRKMRRKILVIRGILRLSIILLVLFGSIFCAYRFIIKNNSAKEGKLSNLVVNSSAGKNNSQLNYILKNENNFTTELIQLAKRNSEAIQFVYDYPQNKDKVFTISLDDEVSTDKVPLFIQWDERWGYSHYGESIIGINGCGPTCLSMVAVHLLGNVELNPKWMANYSEEEGYCSESGTLWALMSDGAKKLGLESVEIPLDESRIYSNLNVGNPIICSMGPGAFTTEGHFIVLCGMKEGKIIINDPNSRKNSEKLWTYDEIQDQIKNLWVFR